MAWDAKDCKRLRLVGGVMVTGNVENADAGTFSTNRKSLNLSMLPPGVPIRQPEWLDFSPDGKEFLAIWFG